MLCKNLYFLILVSFFYTSSVGQQAFRLEYYSSQAKNFQYTNSERNIHTLIKPVFAGFDEESQNMDTIEAIDKKDRFLSSGFKTKWIYRKLRTESFVKHHSENFTFELNPLFNFELKRDDSQTENLYTNTRGFEMMGNLGRKVYFYSSLYENQARFEPYVRDYIKKTLVVPGQGAPKFKKNDLFDYSSASGFLFFSLSERLKMQMGYSKQFIGEGYRSILLSDNSYNYPFLRIQYSFGKFQYSVLWSQHQSFKTVYYDYHFRKYNAINYISWIPTRGIEFSLLESIEWPGNLANEKKLTINFFNPLIFCRTLQYGLNNEKNILLGFNSKIRLYNFAQFYGQLAIDNLQSDSTRNRKFAFQAGLKHFDLFHHKFMHHSLFMQIEYNYIAPYMYAFKDKQQAFTHYNQPLQHPSGTGLKEVLGIAEYSFRDLRLRVKASYMVNSVDTLNSNFGSDLFKNDESVTGIVSHLGNNVGLGIRNETFKISSELIFLINPSSNMQIFTQLEYRKVSSIVVRNDDLIFTFGFRTNIANYYYDF